MEPTYSYCDGKRARAPDLHARITETTYLSASAKGTSSQVTSSSLLGTFFSGNSSLWPVMQNESHGDQLEERVKYHTELGFWGNLGITPCSKTVKLQETPLQRSEPCSIVHAKGALFFSL